MADPKGISFGGNNLGLATVLPDSNPAALVAMEEQRKAQAAALKAKQEAERSKRKQKHSEMLKVDAPDIIWMDKFKDELMAPTVEEIKKMYDEGRHDDADTFALRKGLELQNYSAATHQAAEMIAAEKESIFENSNLTQEGKEAIWKSTMESGVMNEDGSLKDPQQIKEFQQNLHAEGASQHYDIGSNVKRVLDNPGFKQITVTLMDQNKNIEHVSDSHVKVGGHKVSVEALPFVDVDMETGERSIKSAQELIEGGVVDNLMNDPYMARIVDDEVSKRNPNILSQDMEMARADVIRGILSGYKGGGKFEKSDMTKYLTKRAVTNVSVGDQKDADFENSADKWMQDLQSGDEKTMENAMQYLSGHAWVDGRTVVSAKMMSPHIIELTVKNEKGSTKLIESKNEFGYDDAKSRTIKGDIDHILVDVRNKSERDMLLNQYSEVFNKVKRHYKGLSFDIEEGDAFDITNFE